MIYLIEIIRAIMTIDIDACEICGEPDASSDGNCMMLCDKCHDISKT